MRGSSFSVGAETMWPFSSDPLLRCPPIWPCRRDVQDDCDRRLRHTGDVGSHTW